MEQKRKPKVTKQETGGARNGTRASPKSATQRDRNGYLMNGGAVSLFHLIELVNAADTHICTDMKEHD